MIPELTKRVIDKCIRLEIPFAAYMYPGENTIRFVASLGNDVQELGLSGGKHKFVVAPFDMRSESATSIECDADEATILALPDKVMTDLPVRHLPKYESTDFDSYSQQIAKVVDWHKSNGGKTVLSRVLNVHSQHAPLDVVAEYFKSFPNCFRHIYFTHHTGLWFGATPELLLDYNRDTTMAVSMSLAGTRKKTMDSDLFWDEKNTEEHDMVTEYIFGVFNKYNLNPNTDSGHSLSFGNIEHLCHIIKGQGRVELDALLHDLSPTPAVCGFPKLHALEAIGLLEKHNRFCYGGYVGVNDGNRIRLFVNLRCAFVHRSSESGYCYTLFGGGGITAKSVCDNEWLETACKMSYLYRIITKDDSCSPLFYPLNN